MIRALRAAAAALIVLAAAPAHAQYAKWTQDQRADGHKLDGLPAPGSATAATTRDWVSPGAGYLHASGLGSAVTPVSPIPLADLYTTSVANVTALEALAGSGYRDGTRVYVQTVATDFILHTASSATVDHITVASVGGVGGARWIRDIISNSQWWSATAWWINPSTGSDEATGTSSGTALKTWGEWNRRLYGALLPSGDISVTLMSSAPASDVPHLQNVTSDGFVNFNVTGTATTIASGVTISSPRNPAVTANDHFEVTATGSSAWVQNYLITRTNGTAAYFWGAKDLGSNKLQISPPLSATSGSLLTLVNGDTIKVESLPDLADFWVDPPTLFLGVTLSKVRLIGSSYYGAFGPVGSVVVDRSIVVNNPGGGLFGGTPFSQNVLNNACVVTNGTFNISGQWSIAGGLFGGNGTTSAVAFTNGYSLGGGTVNIVTLMGTEFSITHEARFEKASLMIYDWAGGDAAYIVRLNSFSYVLNMGGERNTALLMRVDQGGRIYGDSAFANWNSGITTNSTPYQVASVNYSAAQLGIDTNQMATRGSGIIDTSGTWSGDLSGKGINPSVVAIHETGGPTQLTIGPIANGELLIRSGATIIGSAGGGFVPTTRTVTGTAPIQIDGDNAAHDLSANRTWSLADTAVTPGSYTYGGFTVDQKGRLTAASSGATPAPVGATYITQTADGTLTNEQALGALASGVMQSVTTTGVVSTFAATANRLVFGSGSSGQLADDADLTYSGDVLTLANSDGSGYSMALTRAGTQTIEKRGSGTFFVGTLGLQDLGLYTNNATRLTVASTGGVTLSSLGSGIVKSTSGLLANAVAGTDYQAPLTFSTGLAGTTTITANISTGVSGGQTAIGGTVSGNNLTLASNTSNDGKIILGSTTGAVFNENSNVLSVGIASANAATSAHFKRTDASGNNLYVENASSGTSAYMGLTIGNNDTIFSGPYFGFWQTGASFTTVGFANASAAWFQLGGGSGNMWFDLHQAAGAFVFSTTTSNTERFRIANNGTVSIAGTAVIGSLTGMLRADSGTVSAASLPSTGIFLTSAGTTATPGGHTGVAYDSGTDALALSDGVRFSLYHVGGPGSSNYERVTTYDNSGQVTTQTEAGGTGNTDNVSLRTIAKQVDLCNGSCASFFSIQPTGQLLETANMAVTSADPATANTITLSPTATVSGSTAITANVFAGVKIDTFNIASAANVTKAATLDISAPAITGGGAITTKFTIFARSMIHVENGGGTVFELPQDTTSNSTATQGRIPILVNGATKYLRYYND